MINIATVNFVVMIKKNVNVWEMVLHFVVCFNVLKKNVKDLSVSLTKNYMKFIIQNFDDFTRRTF